MPIEITLNALELDLTKEVAQRRNQSQRSALRHDGKVIDCSLQADLLGAEGELAVAKALQLPWDGEWLPIPIWDHWKLTGCDVSGLEVRTTSHFHGRLILHHNDKDNTPYILVIATHRPIFKLAGWILARDGKQIKFWRSDVPRPCFMVPQANLNAMDTLQAALSGNDLKILAVEPTF